MDIFITGLDTDGAKTILYEVNSENKINTPPSAISEIEIEDLGFGKVRFSWDAPSDDFSSNLGYNIKLGTTPGGSELSNTLSDLSRSKVNFSSSTFS